MIFFFKTQKSDYRFRTTQNTRQVNWVPDADYNVTNEYSYIAYNDNLTTWTPLEIA